MKHYFDKYVQYRSYRAVDMIIKTEDIPSCVPRRYLRTKSTEALTVEDQQCSLLCSQHTHTHAHITSSRRTSSLLRISALSNWAFVALTAVSKIPVRLCWYKVVAGRTSSGLERKRLLPTRGGRLFVWEWTLLTWVGPWGVLWSLPGPAAGISSWPASVPAAGSCGWGHPASIC